MTVMAALLPVLLLAAPADDEEETRQAQDRVLRHVILREVYSGIVRDGLQGMRLEPLPFTKRLPAGAPDIDAWPATGYEDDTLMVSPASDHNGQKAIESGLCAAGESACRFSFVYLFAVQRSYQAGKPDQVGIRFLARKDGRTVMEGVMWGSEKSPVHYLRDNDAWRRVTDHAEQLRMNAAVDLMYHIHREDLQRLADAGRIILER